MASNRINYVHDPVRKVLFFVKNSKNVPVHYKLRIFLNQVVFSCVQGNQRIHAVYSQLILLLKIL